MPMTINQIIAKFNLADGRTPAEAKELAKKIQAGEATGPTTKPGVVAKTADAAKSTLDKASSGDIQTEIQNALGPTNELVDALTSAFQQISKFREESQAFFKSGYTGQMFNYAKSIDAANDASYKLNGNFQAGALVMDGLREGFKSMSMVSEQFTERLSTNMVTLEGAGFNMRQFSAVIEDSVMAFNASEEEVNKLTATLVNTSKQMAIAPAELTENFSYAQKNFAYTSEKMMRSFQGLQKMAKTTGVDFKSLADAFGSSMDTFDGSARKAGQLNQILGKSVFNSIELLNMTEEERATKVRDAIMNSGRSIEEMGKFEILALKDTLGLGSVAETKKFLRGDLKLDDKGKMDKIKAADPVAKSGEELASSLKELRNGIRGQRGPITQTLIDMNSAYREHLNRVGAYGTEINLARQDLARSQQLLAMIDSAANRGEVNRSGAVSLSGNIYKQNEVLTSLNERLSGLSSFGQIVTDNVLNVKAVEFVGKNIPGLNEQFGKDLAVAFGSQLSGAVADVLKGAITARDTEIEKKQSTTTTNVTVNVKADPGLKAQVQK